MVVISPSDDFETRKLVEKITKYEGPVYLRLSRQKTASIYEPKESNQTFEIGKGIQIGEGKDATVFATGVTVAESIRAKNELAKEGINIRVIDMHTIKPIDREIIIKSANETNVLVSVEDHSIIGGLGSAICEVLCDESPKKLIRMGINDCFGKSGLPKDLIKYFKIDAESIKNVIKG